jgi:hypothetical protein
MRTAVICAVVGAAMALPGCRRHQHVVVEDRRPAQVVVQQPVREREVIVREPVVEREVIVEQHRDIVIEQPAPRDVVVVQRPVDPPAPRVEVRTEAPSREHVYLEGYYDFRGSDWVWVPGRWERPMRPDAKWVPGRWVRVEGGYMWEPGHWE